MYFPDPQIAQLCKEFKKSIQKAKNLKHKNSKKNIKIKTPKKSVNSSCARVSNPVPDSNGKRR